MKKVLGVVVVLILVSSIGFGQMAFKGGVSLATFGGDDAKSAVMIPKNRNGFVAGVSYNIGLLLGLSIQPEVLYVQKGGVYENVPLSVFGIPSLGTAKMTESMNYVEVPVLVKFAPLPIPVLKPYIEAGASYAILLSSKTKIEAEGTSEEADSKDGYVKNDVSLIVGAGVDLSLGLIGLNVDVRYVMGQTKLVKDTDAKFFNRGVQATVGLAF